MSLLHDRPARVEALGAVPTDGVEDLLRRVPPDPYLDQELDRIRRDRLDREARREPVRRTRTRG